MNAKDLLVKDYPKLGENCTISELISLMIKTKNNFALIFSGKKYLGYADKKSLMKPKIDPGMMKVRKILKNIPKLSPEDNELKIAKAFNASDTRALPVFENKKVIGIVNEGDFVGSLKDYYKKARAEELMSKDLLILNEDDEISRAITSMKRKNVHRAPVVDEKNNLSGIVSLVDLFTKYYLMPNQRIKISRAASHQKGKRTGYGVAQKSGLAKLSIKNIMTLFEYCACCSKDAKISEVIALMKKENVSSIVVVEKSKPVGIITLKDIIKDFSKR